MAAPVPDGPANAADTAGPPGLSGRFEDLLQRQRLLRRMRIPERRFRDLGEVDGGRGEVSSSRDIFQFLSYNTMVFTIQLKPLST